ncbi:MAG: 50S ribosomal protein L6 [Candidatus Peregrinibacteria bacterium]|nr:50S ribosomal protein L6 [Candidatus Peregrinibacteria bacterium]MDZ4245416.1 50S ribosomal protein L6 [Candidatus Gracilibacteria bacterium]
MSRIGKQKIEIPSGVEVNLTGQILHVKSPKGELTLDVHPVIQIEISEGCILVKRSTEDKLDRGLHGLTRSLVSNMVEGVTKGFEKRLEILGVGYRAQVQGTKLVLSLGHSHPIEYPAPDGITLSIDAEKKNIVIVSGIDKQKVGQVAAEIREFRKPEPYKGKGVRYLGEFVRRKAGKSAAK